MKSDLNHLLGRSIIILSGELKNKKAIIKEFLTSGVIVSINGNEVFINEHEDFFLIENTTIIKCKNAWLN